MNGNIPNDVRVKLLKDLLRVRKTEETLADRYKAQEMRTPTHFGIGQEAVAVGVCAVLTDDDVAYSHHRSHNHYLAKGGSIYGLAAELFGKESGCSRGRGGSVHLTCRERGFIASSAILGETVAAAVGSAFSIKMDGARILSCAFFGDAVLEEGVFYESISFASMNELPVLLVCENNGYATESPLSVRQPKDTRFCERVRAFGVSAESVDGNDVEAVFRASQEAVEHIRGGKGPFFLECKTYRWCEHVGPYFDHEMGRTYRTKEEVDFWMDKCPIKRSSEMLVSEDIVTAAEITEWELEVQNHVDNEIARAYEAPWPETSALFEGVG